MVLSNVLCECWLVSRILLVLWWWVSCNVIIFCYGEAAGNEWDYCNLIITDINASWTLQIKKEKNDWKFLVRGQGGGGRNWDHFPFSCFILLFFFSYSVFHRFRPLPLRLKLFFFWRVPFLYRSTYIFLSVYLSNTISILLSNLETFYDQVVNI